MGRVKKPSGECEETSEILIEEDFSQGLDGIEGFSHIFILSYLHRYAGEKALKVKPRRLLKRGAKLEELPLLGVFSLDSPVRPNPIGLSLVKLVERRGNVLIVEGLDLLARTPVLDIKPYFHGYRVESFTLPQTHLALLQKYGEL
ncbi:MAG: tRNA (N6-threonylcarbamoyladenosine(37)-N6)-methyltransferase TrmO [Thermoplasmata archaeon]